MKRHTSQDGFPSWRSPFLGPLAGLLLLCVPCAALPVRAQEAKPEAFLAWFTDADIPDAQRVEAPEPGLPAAPGTEGKGVRLTREVALEVPLLAKESGMIGFWIRPEWDGNDGRSHRLLRIGEPEKHGLLVEKAATGMLRFVMATPRKITASRADVSHWRAGEWHHVVVVWMSRKGRPLGLPLWIDRVAVAGPVAGGDCFPDPAALEDRRVHVGHPTSEAVMDELVFRRKLRTELSRTQIALVYRDYFRTAPVDRIEIDPEPLRVPADRRVVVGHQKQFGLLAGPAQGLRPFTDFAVRYGQWAGFDAKPLIRWETTAPEIASVDEQGRVAGKAVGRCELVAHFRGRTGRYPLNVIPVERADLVLVSVSLGPRHVRNDKIPPPGPGDRGSITVRIENFGFVTAPSDVPVLLETFSDADRNFVLERDAQPLETHRLPMKKALEPRGATTVQFPFTWPADPVWVRVRVDPEEQVDEISEANNVRAVLSSARPMQWGYQPRVLDAWHRDRTINHTGSFCYFDWLQAQADRCNVMLREAVYPTTSPVGVADAIRTQAFTAMKGGEWKDEPWVRQEKFFDGGFPVGEKVDPMAVDAAILHEFGHTCLALPDLYGYPVRPSCILLRDEAGALFAGTDRLPAIHDWTVFFPSAVNVPCGVGYDPLMVGCHLYLHPAHAGQVHHLVGRRGKRFWGVQGALIPKEEHILEVLDVEDRPLAGAAVYVYHVAQVRGGGAGSKYFADHPKFVGRTGQDGRWRFPKRTAPGWDDPDTDEVEHGIEVWNPFGQAPIPGEKHRDVAFTPNVGTVEGLLLLKIVTTEDTEFAWLCLTDFNEAFFRGETKVGVFRIRTSLRPTGKEAPLKHPRPARARRTRNLRPVAVLPADVTVRCGKRFSIDGSRSHDPERRPIVYQWSVPSGGLRPPERGRPVFESVAPREPRDLEVRLHVIDGVRASRAVSIRVHCVPSRKQMALPIGGVWRYTTAKPRDGWNAPKFDTTGWSRGKAGFGGGRVQGGEIETKWDADAIWLRRRFKLAKGEKRDRLRLYLFNDCAVEVYLNGVLAASLGGRREGYHTVWIRREALAGLRAGGNVLAVNARAHRKRRFVDVGVFRR